VRWSREAGLRLEETTGMTYNPITRRYRLAADCDVNYLVCCSRDA
jgi:2-polyprenyl-6-hydroxyphenyl methylase/3-demethylubiquinone-9 3-methyltransferase